MHNFAKVLNLDQKNIVVMATEFDAYKIMKTKDMQSRRDPTKLNYIEVLEEFVNKAKLNPNKNYLQIQSFCGHGYHITGSYHILTSYYDTFSKYYEIIPVEALIGYYMNRIPNVFFLVFCATSREIAEKVLGSCSGGRAGNFIFTFGCSPGSGINADSKYLTEIKKQITAEFNQNGSVILPDAFFEFIFSETKIETIIG